MISRLLSFFGLVLALTGCSSVSLLNSIIPDGGYSVHKDIAYGDDPRQQLDIYVPNNLSGSAPVVVFFYGGSWQMGSKSDYHFVGQAFASKGYVVVIADYRLYPQVYFPVFIQDGAKAFAWVHAHIGEYQGDSNNLFLAGHSAGAYIAGMLSVNPHYLQEAHAKQSWVRGTISLAGPFDFLPFTDPKIKALFSTAPDAQTQPITFVGNGAPPMLLLTGDADNQVSPLNSVHLAKKLRQYNDEVTEKIYPGVGHIGIVLSLAHGFRWKTSALNDSDAFIRAHVR